MLIEVLDDGAALMLDDGSRWDVSPGDIPTVSTWSPTAALQIAVKYCHGVTSARILNRENNVAIHATQEDPSNKSPH